MSLSCMELQLDQWLLTKGRSSTGCGDFLNPIMLEEAKGVVLGHAVPWVLSLRWLFSISSESPGTDEVAAVALTCCYCYLGFKEGECQLWSD